MARALAGLLFRTLLQGRAKKEPLPLQCPILTWWPLESRGRAGNFLMPEKREKAGFVASEERTPSDPVFYTGESRGSTRKLAKHKTILKKENIPNKTRPELPEVTVTFAFSLFEGKTIFTLVLASLQGEHLKEKNYNNRNFPRAFSGGKPTPRKIVFSPLPPPYAFPYETKRGMGGWFGRGEGRKRAAALDPPGWEEKRCFSQSKGLLFVKESGSARRVTIPRSSAGWRAPCQR